METPTERQPRVLLVDDAVDDLTMYGEYLTSKGYEVTTASDGEIAVNLALRQEFDIFVIDIAMPRLDGLGVMMVLRNYNRTRRIPIVSLSARAGLEHRTAAVEAGANLALEKPCPPEELEATLKVLLDRRK
jgi:DNA-binding response OmpR family regulator